MLTIRIKQRNIDIKSHHYPSAQIKELGEDHLNKGQLRTIHSGRFHKHPFVRTQTQGKDPRPKIYLHMRRAGKD